MVREKEKVNTWREEIAAQAQAAKATEDSAATGSSFISLKGGRISIDGAEVPGSAIDVIILDHALENQFHTEDYDPNSPSSPDCFAFGRAFDQMAPHADCLDPQSEVCKGCPKLEWNSGKKGKGKACKEVRRLAVIMAEDVGDSANAEVRMVKIPVMSTKHWTGYVRHCADVLHLPPLGVITRMKVTSDNMVTVTFSFVDKVDEAYLPGLLQRKKLVEPDLFHPYTPVQAPPPPPPPRARKYNK